jgi:hypothetical protein
VSSNDSPAPLRYDLEVPADGRIQVQVPLPAGSHVSVYVVEQQSAELSDLLAAAVSSTEFWNNPEDDEDWNNA